MLYDLAERILRRRAARQRIGWTDFCRDSYDRRKAQAQAWRIIQRINHGRRITLWQAMND